MTQITRLLSVLAVALLPVLARAEPVVIFAAASLKAPLDEILQGQDVVVSYGGSGAMAQQIANGAPADIYFSANVAWVDWLEGRGIGGPRVDMLSNALVIVAGRDWPETDPMAQMPLQGAGQIGLGQTQSVPVGIYARQSLIATGHWEDVQTRIIEFPSASAVLRAVELAEVPQGIVYLTDAVRSDQLRHIVPVPPHSHDPIVYPMLLLEADAQDVFAYLQSEAAQEIFRAHHFDVLSAP